MIDALESLNLTQRSQSNAKEMSWDERDALAQLKVLTNMSNIQA
jgi:hypothetical protein